MLHSENLMTEIKNKKDTLFSVLMFAIFFAIVVYYLFSIVVTEDNIRDYADIRANPYEKYEKMMSGEGIKSLIGNKQFMEFRYNDKLDDLIQKSGPNTRDNLFNETF